MSSLRAKVYDILKNYALEDLDKVDMPNVRGRLMSMGVPREEIKSHKSNIITYFHEYYGERKRAAAERKRAAARERAAAVAAAAEAAARAASAARAAAERPRLQEVEEFMTLADKAKRMQRTRDRLKKLEKRTPKKMQVIEFIPPPPPAKKARR